MMGRGRSEAGLDQRRFAKELFLYQFAQDVAERDVAFLNPRGHRRRHHEGMVGEAGQLAAGTAGPGNRRQAAWLAPPQFPSRRSVNCRWY